MQMWGIYQSIGKWLRRGQKAVTTTSSTEGHPRQISVIYLSIYQIIEKANAQQVQKVTPGTCDQVEEPVSGFPSIHYLNTTIQKFQRKQNRNLFSANNEITHS